MERLPGWKVWSVDRRENRLEDHWVLDDVLARRRPVGDLFRYYLQWITDPWITPHFEPVGSLSAVPPRNAFVRTVVPFLRRAE